MLLERVLAIEITPIKREPEFEARFRNWVRFCEAKGIHQARAGSAEGAWRSPQCWDPPGPRPAEIDLLDALEVNKAYVRLSQLANKQARVIQFLVFKYKHARPQYQGQLLGIHYTRLDEALERAKTMLKNQLTVA